MSVSQWDTSITHLGEKAARGCSGAGGGEFLTSSDRTCRVTDVKTDGIREGCGFEKLENTKMKAIEKWGAGDTD